MFTDPVHAETPWADPYGTPPPPPPPQTVQTRMEREYIWAAHETAGVNELHVAIDWFDREAWPIQDAHNQTVMGYADAAGDLVEQRVYTPFGQVLNTDKTALANPGGLYNDFRFRLGHHGLFADRLDADTTSPVLRHADARVICLTNNRVYEPTRGSWMQRDPNATGMLTQSSLMHSGSAGQVAVNWPSAMRNYSDGANAFAAMRSNPIAHADPTGLLVLTADLASSFGARGMLSGLLSGATQTATSHLTALGFTLASSGSFVFISGLDAAFFGEMSSSDWGGIFDSGSGGMNPDPNWFNETFTRLKDAIGQEAVGNSVTKIKEVATKNQDLIDRGFTRTIYARVEETGRQFTVHFDPVMRLYAGAHPSSSN